MSNIRYKGGERFFSKETFLRQCHLTCLLDVDKRLVSNFQENSFCHYHLACLVDVDTRAAFLSSHHLLVWWQEHVPAEDVGGDDVLLEFNAFRNSHLAHIDQIRVLPWHLNSRNLSCVLLEVVDIDSAHRQVWSPVTEQPLHLDFFCLKVQVNSYYMQDTHNTKIHKSTSSGEALKPLLFAQMLPSWPAMAAAVTIPLAISCGRGNMIEE